MKSENVTPSRSTRSTAPDFLAELPDQPDTSQGPADGITTPGVKMRDLFALAKKHMHMAVEEIDKLLTSPVYAHRVGAISIMDWQARAKQTTDADRKALFDLYINRHTYIGTWSLVDRAAPYVVGGYLDDKPRDVLYGLARSENLWERRTAITSTYYFIRKNDLQTTFDIAEILVKDPEYFVQTAVGGWIREAGKKDKAKLIQFLDRYCSVMPPVMLRFAVEHLDKQQREYYGSVRKKAGVPKRQPTKS